MKKIVCDIEKNTRETIRVELDEYEGRQLISARCWYKNGDELKPGRNGLSLAVRHLPALREALEEAERVARDAGLLDGGAP